MKRNYTLLTYFVLLIFTVLMLVVFILRLTVAHAEVQYGSWCPLWSGVIGGSGLYSGKYSVDLVDIPDHVVRVYCEDDSGMKLLLISAEPFSYVYKGGVISTDNLGSGIVLDHKPVDGDAVEYRGYYFFTYSSTIGNMTDCQFYGVPAYFTSASEYIDRIVSGEEKFPLDPRFSGSLSNPVFDSDLGYLVITKAYRYNHNEGLSVKIFSKDLGGQYFEWAPQSSTGLDLTGVFSETGRYRVRMDVLVDAPDLKCDGMILETYYHNPAVLMATINEVELKYKMDMLPEVVDLGFIKYMSTPRHLRVRFRIESYSSTQVIPDKNSGWSCGPWRTLQLDSDGTLVVNDIEGYSSTDNVDTGLTSVGNANDLSSISQKINMSQIDISNYTGTISDFADQVRIMPGIIAQVLSFLPPWCLNLIALSIGTLCVLILIKFVRG